MRLRDLLDESAVKLGLESLDKEECFEEMIDLLVRNGRVTDRERVLEAIREREIQQTTGIGKGIAVPHGKLTSIDGLVAALGMSAEGIEFDSSDGKPVHLVFLLLGRVGEPGPHLQALAEIGRLLETPGFYKRMIAARTSQEVLDILDDEE